MKTIEQIKKEIEFLLSRARGTGRTTRLAKLVKKQNGILVVVNASEAKFLREKFGITVYSINELDRLYGDNNPVFVDHFVYEVLINDLMHIISNLRITYGTIETTKKRRQNE